MQYLIIFMLLILTACTPSTDERLRRTHSVPMPSASQTQVPTPTATPAPEPQLAASYNTPILDKDPNRVSNIRLAAKTVNGYVLKPGEEFSFNNIVGRRTTARGYKRAAILKGDDHASGIGGGVCQVCATIYNAAREGGFEITEHHNHKIEVAYAPDKTDATVNYGSLDFKFKNNSDNDIRINVHVSDNKVYCEIYKIG